MKKSLSIYGLFTGCFAIISLAFKVLHWPGSSMMLFVATLLVLLFVVLYGCHLSKNENISKFIVWLNVVIFMFMAVAALFKLQHFPGGGMMVMISAVLALVDFIVMLIYVLKK